MKKISFFISMMLLGIGVFSQCTVTIIGSTNVSCNGVCDGSVTLATTGLPPFTYLWSPGGQTAQNPTNLCAGMHTVTMTDASSCVATTTVTITEPAALQDSIYKTNVSACDSCNGTATASPSGGTAPYTHNWSTIPPQATASISNLCPGVYYDTIVDANNCQFIDSATISQAATLTLSVNVTNTSSSTACDGGATANPSGGTTPYTYAWSPGGQTTASVIAKCPNDTLMVCVTDADGCSICDSNVVISGPVGIREQSIGDLIHIFPNPSVGQFTVLFDNSISTANLSVVNLLGEEVFQSTINNPKTKIDLTNQANGIYFINLNTPFGSVIHKIIIQK